MSDENSEKPDKPDPIEDVRKGLGLLFRAAKSTLDQLPTRQLEEAVVSGAREVGRAIENVTGAIDKQIFKRDAGAGSSTSTSPADATPAEAKVEPSTGTKAGETKPGETKPGSPAEPAGQPDHEGEPRGPRVG